MSLRGDLAFVGEEKGVEVDDFARQELGFVREGMLLRMQVERRARSTVDLHERALGIPVVV